MSACCLHESRRTETGFHNVPFNLTQPLESTGNFKLRLARCFRNELVSGHGSYPINLWGECQVLSHALLLLILISEQTEMLGFRASDRRSPGRLVVEIPFVGNTRQQVGDLLDSLFETSEVPLVVVRRAEEKPTLGRH